MTKRRSGQTSSSLPQTGAVTASDFGRAVGAKQAANTSLEMSMVIYGITVLGMDEQSAVDVANDVMESHVKSSKAHLSTVELLTAYREAAKGVLPL